MSQRPTLLEFIDDELLRAPMTIDQVIDVVQAQWRERRPGPGRSDADPARVLYHHRGDVVTRALVTLRASALADLQATTADPAVRPRPALESADLSLIDEDDVAVDIGIARCTQSVKLEAEVDLRELQTYTAALANDLNVSRDTTNPFRPERFVPALWAGVQTLPLSDAMKAVFLNDAAGPLSKALRRAYAAARQRLHDQGVTPARYRTIVNRDNTAWGVSLSRLRPPDGLGSPWDAVSPPPPAQGSGASPPASAPGQTDQRPAAAVASPDPRRTELLARLFEAIQNDLGLAADLAAVLQRLQPTALRVALREPSLLERHDHALWRFMDQLAHDLETSAPDQRLQLLGLGRNLVDHLAQAEAGDGLGFAWALERLLAAQRRALSRAAAAAGTDIAKLQRIADAEATPTTLTMPLDIGTLDTVPGDLLDTPPEASGAAVLAAGGLPAGATLRAYLQGEWRTLQSLWQDDRHELALLRDTAIDRRWALHQRALARLVSEGLARRYQRRSLIRRAAERVVRVR